MASIRSALRKRRKPSTPSSLASRCRSASGDSASAEGSSTEDIRVSFSSVWVGRRPAALWSAAGNLARGRLAAREAVRGEALVGGELALAAQYGADGQEVGRRRH